MQSFIVSEQVDRLTTMAEIAGIEYSLVCSELVLDAMVEASEPLPEVCVDVKAGLRG